MISLEKKSQENEPKQAKAAAPQEPSAEIEKGWKTLNTSEKGIVVVASGAYIGILLAISLILLMFVFALVSGS